MPSFVFFHNPDEENGYLSNWYMRDFYFDGILFTSAEQFMMYSKAVLFDDKKIAKKILSITDVAEIKDLGRQVHKFDDKIWDANKKDLMVKGLYAKFACNKDLADKLVSTGDKVLAECAVKDRIWGIGLSMHDKRRFDTSCWTGQNLLGECLMTVRGMLNVK